MTSCWRRSVAVRAFAAARVGDARPHATWATLRSCRERAGPQEVPVLAKSLGQTLELVVTVALNTELEEDTRVHALTFVSWVAELYGSGATP